VHRGAIITKLVHGNEHVSAAKELSRQSIGTLLALKLGPQSFDLCARCGKLIHQLINRDSSIVGNATHAKLSSHKERRAVAAWLKDYTERFHWLGIRSFCCPTFFQAACGGGSFFGGDATA
jgi:hypothetical protein